MISKEEFEKQYAENSKMSIEELRKNGLRVVPCDGADCDYDKCEGWKVEFFPSVIL